MSSHLARNLKPIAAWSIVAIAGAATGWFNARAHRTEHLADLRGDAKRSAVAFEGHELRGLSGTRADLGTPAYAAIKERLRKLQAVTPEVRFVYIFRAEAAGAGGKVIYLADSAAPGAKDESLPGDVYPQAGNSPGLQDIIRTGEPATEGPLSDGFGTWLTGYVLIAASAPAAGTPPVTEIIGIDVDAANWNRALWLAGFRGAFYVWILLGLPLGAWFVLRRQFEQRDVIRNLSEAMEQSHSALMIVDLQSRIEYANRGLCQQMGYSRRELIGRQWREFQVADTPEAVLAELTATVRAGRTWEGEWFNQRKNGSTYPVRGVITPVKLRDGTLSCFVAVFDDMTEIKRREAELRDARDLAQAGDRAKSQFLATMSHEVRTPLNGIVGFTSLLLETNLEPEQREYVQTIRASGEALIQLTGDILDFARIESGKLKLDPLPCDPRECVEEALDLLAAKAAEKRIELLHLVAPDVPGAIMIDGGRLRQVLVNLIGNAVKFTERGEVRLTVTRADRPGEPSSVALPNAPPRGPDECELVFAVRDSGIGIAPEQHGKLFRPFSQLDETSTRRYGGTGLGLAISRNLVRLLGGDIQVSSELGKGAEFTFSVRAALAAPPPAPHDLAGLRVALVATPGPLRSHLETLLGGWNAALNIVPTATMLADKPWDVALVDVSDELCEKLTATATPAPEQPPQTTFGLIPISLPSEARHQLRTHFRLLINKPVHHEPLFTIVSGTNSGSATRSPAPTRFGLRVLVVEDNPVNQRLMQRMLQNLGCTWTIVANGQLALDELEQRAGDYDIVLLDLHMPEMDGITALEKIRLGKVGAKAETIWIVAVTADAREDQRARALQAGLNDYLTKPLKLAELEAAFRRFRSARLLARR